MGRLFSKSQRDAILFNSGGYCQSCGEKLTASWHADHVIPFSRGGKTDVINGQALCAACNLSKGSKMDKKLRDWQTLAIREGERMLRKKFEYVVVACPASGKTTMAVELFRSFGEFQNVIVASPVRDVRESWKDKFSSIRVNLKTSGVLNRYDDDYEEYTGMSFTYSFVDSQHEKIRKYIADHPDTLVIADEYHHISDNRSWGDSFYNAFSGAKNLLILSGTPWTATGLKMPFVDNYDKNGIIIPDFQYSLSKAIDDRVCRSPVFSFMDLDECEFISSKTGELKKYNSFSEAREADKTGNEENKCYSLAVNNDDIFISMFQKANEQLTSLIHWGVKAPAGLIVAPSIETAHKYAEIVTMVTGITPVVVDSKQEKAHQKITTFSKSSDRWIVSVEMISEGVDIPRVQVELYLHTSKTRLFLLQVFGRAQRVISGNDLDLNCYIYCLKHSEIEKTAKEIEAECRAGLRLKKESDQEEPEKDSAGGGDRVRLQDILLSIGISQSEIVTAGESFSVAVQRQAMELRQRKKLSRIPFHHICAMVCEIFGEERSEDEEVETIPLEDKKLSLRSALSKRLRAYTHARLGRLGRKPTSGDFKDDTLSITKAAGIRAGVATATMDQLKEAIRIAQRRFDHVQGDTDYSS